MRKSAFNDFSYRVGRYLVSALGLTSEAKRSSGACTANQNTQHNTRLAGMVSLPAASCQLRNESWGRVWLGCSNGARLPQGTLYTAKLHQLD